MMNNMLRTSKRLLSIMPQNKESFENSLSSLTILLQVLFEKGYTTGGTIVVVSTIENMPGI